MDKPEEQDSEVQLGRGSKSIIIAGGVVLLLVVVVGVYASTHKKTKHNMATMPDMDMMSGDTSNATNNSSTSTHTNTSSSMMSTSESTVTIGMTAGNYYFTPNTITVSKGTKVKINMIAKDMTHNFNIDALDLSIPSTTPGITNSIEFTANTTGSFEYYCSIGNHKAMGQVGKLIVK